MASEHSENSSYYERLLEEELAKVEFDSSEEGEVDYSGDNDRRDILG